jgi:gamma-glutamyltranspeptidase
MNLEDTYSARRFSTRHFIGSFGQGRPRINDLRVHESVSENVINELKKRGHIVSTSRGNVGGVAMLEIDQESGIVSAAGGRCGSLDPVAE